MTERAGCKVDFDKNKDSFEYCDVPAITDAKNSKLVLDCQKDVLYALAACVNMNWLSIVVSEIHYFPVKYLMIEISYTYSQYFIGFVIGKYPEWRFN